MTMHGLNPEKYENETTGMRRDYDIFLNEQPVDCGVRKGCW